MHHNGAVALQRTKDQPAPHYQQNKMAKIVKKPVAHPLVQPSAAKNPKGDYRQQEQRHIKGLLAKYADIDIKGHLGKIDDEEIDT